MRYKEDGLTGFTPNGEQLIIQHFSRQKVDGREGLVHQEYWGIISQRPSDGSPLTHSAGKLSRQGVAEAGQANQLNQPVRSAIPFGSRHPDRI